MKTRGFFKRCMAFILAGAVALPAGSFFPAKAAAKEKRTFAAGKSVSRNKDSVKKLVEEIPAAFTKLAVGQAFEEKKVVPAPDASVQTPEYKALEANEGVMGLLVTGDTGAISSTRLELGTFDFGTYKAGRLIYQVMIQRKTKGTIYFYKDNETESFVSVSVKRQKKKNIWADTTAMCVDVSKFGLTGEHRISVRVVYSEAVDEKGDANQAVEKRLLASTGNTASVFLESVLFSESSTPVMDFSIDEELGTIAEMNADSNHDTECYGDVTLQVPEGYVSEYSDKTFETQTCSLDYIRGRGNSTWMTSKKPYKLKFDKKQDFFGMGANKHWVLLANYYDYTLLRNKYTYWLGEQMGMEYTPKSVPVEVVMNGEYLGSYFLCEQVRVGKTRVDIDDLEEARHATDEETISGGYLLSMEESENLQSVATEHYNFNLENPEFNEENTDEAVEAQRGYIEQYLQKLENAVYGKDFKDEDGKSYTDYLDVLSTIDYYLFQEFSSNGDGYLSGSTYLYKKRNGLVYWGPLWDFDFVAWAAYQTNAGDYEDIIHVNRAPWIKQLLSDPQFKEKMVSEYHRLAAILRDSIKEGGQLDKYAEQIYFSQYANYQVKSSYLADGMNYWDPQDQENTFGNDEFILTYDNEIARLKEWITNRLGFMDENIENLEGAVSEGNVPIRFMVDDELYAEMMVTRDGDGDAYIRYEDMPADPVKAGYVFLGWYMTNEDGEEVRLTPDKFIHLDSEEGDTFYAKWQEGTIEDIIQGIRFKNDTYYYMYYQEDEDYMGYSLSSLITTFPFHLPIDSFTWSVDDPSVAEITEDGTIMPKGYGEVTVTASAYGKTASCKIEFVDGYDAPGDFQVDAKLTMEKGAYGQIKVNFLPTNRVYTYYDRMTYFAAADESILDITEDGFVYAKKAGTTPVVVYNGELNKVHICEVIVTGGVAPAEEPLKKGTTFKVAGVSYKVNGNQTVTCAKGKSNVKKATVPDTITYQNVVYKVTEIGAKAFANNKKLTGMTIGKNVTAIGKRAFAGCKRLKKIKVKTKKLKSVGKYARKGVPKKCRMSYPKGKKKAYKNLFRRAG